MLRKLFAVILSIWINQVAAQFGFEWIKPYQPYYKFTITQKGVYQIDSLQLAQNGIAIQNIKPARLQLFKNGIEQPIFIPNETDGIFNATDYIEFYAEPNNGMLDTELYKSASEQPHTYNSLFTDTAVYFLTILPDTTVIIAKRFALNTDTASVGFLAEPNYKAIAVNAPINEYYRGAVLPASERYYISEYAGAEGWCGRYIGLGEFETYLLNTRAAVTGSNAVIKIKVIGASDFFLSDPNLPNHHIRIYAGSSTNPTFLIADTTYRGYGERLITKVFPANVLGNITYIKLEVVNDLGVGSDFNALSYVELTYTKSGDASSSSAFNEIRLDNFNTQAKNVLQFSNYNYANAAFLDLTLNQKVKANQQGLSVTGVFTYTQQQRKYILYSQSNTLAVGFLQPVNFIIADVLLNHEFLIVSNKKLSAGASAYKQYRQQKFKTLLVYADELADTYFYGYHHPLAIKRFAAHLYTMQAQKPQYLLLLGRGYQNSLIRNNKDNYINNLVPAIGEPSSDNLFTAGTNGVPLIATGRIPAANNTELLNYLNKLIKLETNADSIALWRKHFLHLSGGTFLAEQQQFTGVVNTLKGYAIQKPTGANVFSYHKNTTLPTQTNLRQTLINHLNQGIHVMTFLGHGSLTVLDMDFGSINDLTENNKPTFYYFNGCNIGNASDVDPLGTGLVYGKDYICAANKGAIGWLAHSNLTLTGLLYTQMYNFYDAITNSGYGLPVGKNIMQALSAAVSGGDEYAKSHALQLLLQGDPAFVIYGPTLPDVKTADNDLFIFPQNANSLIDSLAVGVIVSNLAKATNDTLKIECTRTINGINTTKLLKVTVPAYTDTFYIWFNVSKEQTGSNTFNVKLNNDRIFNEPNYANNNATLNYFLPGSGVRLLWPYNYNNYGTLDSVTFLVQNNNLLAQNQEYIIEIDNSPTFNKTSNYYKTSGIIKAASLAAWKVKLPNNTLTYYWRAKLNVPENAGGVWQMASFNADPTKNSSLNEFYKMEYNQMKNITQQSFMLFNDSLKKIEFADDEFTLGIENRRWDHRRMGVTIPYLLNAGVGACLSQGVVALVFSPFRADYPEELSNYPFNCAFVQANKNDPSIRYYTFNTNTINGENELKQFIDTIPNGYYVAMFSRYSSNINNWQQNTKDKLQLLGVKQKIININSSNTAWAFIGQKSITDIAVEDTITNNDLANAPNLPPLDNEPQDVLALNIRRSIKQKWFYGSFTTDAFGPSKAWLFASVNVEPKAAGRWWYDLIGIKKDGTDTLLITGLTQSTTINQINHEQIPFIKFRFNFVDSIGRTVNTINNFGLLYTKADEVTIFPEAGYKFYNTILQKGDSIDLTIPLLNIGQTQADSTLATITITDENRMVRYKAIKNIGYIGQQDTLVLRYKISTSNLGLNNNLGFTYNSNFKFAEYTYNNNFILTGFLVNSDNKNPMLEVTFDGQRIINGDIVSPNPVIKITSTDDSKFLLQRDTQTFSLMIKQPGSTDFERVNLNSEEVNFIAATENNNQATLIYKPTNLKDGLYTIKINSFDGNGNPAATTDFETDFNVINKSSITHFYPYPNPFTTSTRFVFTLTGNKIPDDLLIRIFTVSGKVVKEINKAAFGNIRIGNNISEYAWDGTDMFGDRLANGVYLYKVLTKINGANIDRRETRARDESLYFINNTGKIYLMR